jgi:predicted ATPase/class 3 adenylate cyclase/Flp pilus assembly protein TadD
MRPSSILRCWTPQVEIRQVIMFGANGLRDPQLPTGIVTFLFTDIEGSTRLLQFLGDTYAEVLGQHNLIMRSHIQAWDGYVIDTQGDAFFAVFSHAADAVAATVAIQRALAGQQWSEGVSVQVRMGLHTGKPILTEEGNYVGLDVHRAARVCSAGHGGQVLLTETTCNLVLSDLPFAISLRDLGEHRLKDLDQPEHLYQLVIPNLPADFPPIRSLEAFVHNLPTPLTSFIGREKEIIEIKHLFSSVRLLTLIGPGGTGKTRLAVQVATELLNTFPDGVRFVELAPVADPTHLPQSIAATLGLHEEPGYALTKTITDYLRPKSLLLILDNCEHLILACAQLAATLLQHCPKLKIMVSSREALGIGGELPFQVPSLTLPPTSPRHLPPIETLTQYEAVRLFIERATSALPNFAVTNQNAPILAQICHQLDGIPLALELAAARIKTLRVEQIAERLDDRFRLLRDSSRSAIPRQQTLKALIDWSHNLLSADEQTLFRRLSVFSGGWTLEAAEGVCGPGGQAHLSDVLDLLAQLVNKSLVVIERTPGEEIRYHFLETIRQYAREKLLEAGEGEAVRHSHWAFFTTLAEVGEFQIRGAGQQQWLHKLDVEHDNIRIALDWALQKSHPDSPWLPSQEPPTAAYGLRLAVSLWWFWFLRGYASEGRGWLETLLERANANPAVPTIFRAKAMSRIGFLAFIQGSYEKAVALAREATTLCQESGDREGLAISLFVMGNVLRSLGKHEQSETAFQQSLALFQELKNEWGIALIIHMLGWTAFIKNDMGRAEALGRESLNLRRQLGVKIGMASSLDLLAAVARSLGDYEQAARLLEESLSLSRELKSRPVTAMSLRQLGYVAGQIGNYNQAIDLYEEALALNQELGDRSEMATLLLNLGIIAWRQGNYEKATAVLEQSQRIRQEIDDPYNLAFVQQALGDVALSQNQLSQAAALYWGSLVSLNKIKGDRKGVADSLQKLAGLSLAEQRQQRAARLLAAATTIRQTHRVVLPPLEQEDYQALYTNLQTELDQSAFDQAWVEGQTAATTEGDQLIASVLDM